MKEHTQIAHGKVILIGEHAALYGHDAIVLPVLKANVHVTLFQSKFDEIDSDFFNGPIEESPPFFLPIITLYQDLKTYFKAKPKKIKIRSMIPLSAGMGSSAALACALTKTFYAFYREVLTKEILFK
jgi:mevalonate kinase